MVKITVKAASNNSRNRRRDRRKDEREKEESNFKFERKLAPLLNGCSEAALKATDLPGETKEPEQESVVGGDAIHKVVNHAHQRDPRKKWS